MKLHNFVRFVKSIKNISEILLPSRVQDFLTRALGAETFLSQVEFHLVDHCNLNCAHCDHFTPLSKPCFIPVEDILSDFKKLKRIFDNVGKIYILGGEPLLHPQLLELFSPLREIYPKSELIIITNGILLEKVGKDFWNALKEYKISLSMTKYPIKVDYEKYIEKCGSMGIKSYFFASGRFCMQKMDLDYKGKQDKKKAFERCWRKRCHFLRDSKLYICTPIPNIRFLNEYYGINFSVGKKDFINLDKEKSAARINRLFNRPVEFCKYCSDSETEFEDYRVSRKEITEWVREESLKDIF